MRDMSQEQAKMDKLNKRIEAGKPIFKDMKAPKPLHIGQPAPAKPAGPSPTLKVLTKIGQIQGSNIQDMRKPGGAMNNMLKKK